MNNEQGFDTAPAIVPQEAGALAAVAQVQHEIQAAIVSAKKFPRDEAASYAKIIRSFERPAMAEDAAYSFPRGGKSVEGPSVQAAREFARCWGNIQYGIRIVSQDAENVHIKGFAVDLETNTRIEAEDSFPKKIQRKNKVTGLTEWITTTDERDLREMVNKRGAIAVRNCILQLIPSDVTADAMQKAKVTLKKSAAGELKANRDDVIKSLVLAFDSIGVSSEMLERRLGHALSLITEDEIVELKAVGKSIRDGNSRREEAFDFPTSGKAADLAATLEARGKKREKGES
jgi:hypothetical protein